MQGHRNLILLGQAVTDFTKGNKSTLVCRDPGIGVENLCAERENLGTRLRLRGVYIAFAPCFTRVYIHMRHFACVLPMKHTCTH